MVFISNFCVYIGIRFILISKTNNMKKVILSSILMIVLSFSFLSCRETKDKAKDAMEETNEALKEVGEDMKKVGEEVGLPTDTGGTDLYRIVDIKGYQA